MYCDIKNTIRFINGVRILLTWNFNWDINILLRKEGEISWKTNSFSQVPTFKCQIKYEKTFKETENQRFLFDNYNPKNILSEHLSVF